MSLLEILKNILKYVVLAPVIAVLGIIYCITILLISVLFAPIIAIISIINGKYYEAFDEFYSAVIEIASIPFALLKAILGK